MGWLSLERLAEELEVVEDEAGAVDVELVGCEAGDDVAEGPVDFMEIARGGEVEAATAAAGVGVGDGFAVGVVVVAEAFTAEGWAAAEVVVVEEVVAGGYVVGFRHGWYTPSPGVVIEAKS